MKILLATPAHGGQVCVGYHESVVNTLMFFKTEYPGIVFVPKIISVALLPVARDILASIALNDPSYTHLLFIDADMGFKPELIAKLVAFQEDVAGVIAPKRKFDYAAFHRVSATQSNPLTARLIAAEYVTDTDIITTIGAGGEVRYEIRDGFLPMRRVGTGILLIARRALEKIKDRYPELWVEKTSAVHRDFGLEGGLLQCFQPVQDASGLYVGEDIAFCQRWVEGCGGKLWALIDEPIVHIGQEHFVGQYLHRLLAASRPTAAAPAGAAPAPSAPLNRAQRRAMARG
jgi:hypothetical protein